MRISDSVIKNVASIVSNPTYVFIAERGRGLVSFRFKETQTSLIFLHHNKIQTCALLAHFF